MIPEIGFFDILITSFWIFLIIILSIWYKNHKIKKKPEYAFYIPALSAKIFAFLIFIIIHIFYYKWGDTFAFFYFSKNFTDLILNNPLVGFKLIFSSAEYLKTEYWQYSQYINSTRYINTTDVLTVIKIASIINLLTLKSFLASSLLFSWFSFIGLWKIYELFTKIYPHFYKILSIPVLFFPSILFWSSGILKDTIIIACFGIFLISIYNFIHFTRVIQSFILIMLCSYFIFLLRPFVLYLLLPSALFWIHFNFVNKIKFSFIRKIVSPLLLSSVIIIAYYSVLASDPGTGKYTLSNIEKTIEGFKSWHLYLAETEGQSGYSLGKISFTPLGLLKLLPASLNVTFFRPYLWEAHNLTTLMGALESFLVFIFFIYILLKIKLMKFFKLIYSNKDIKFCLLFSLTYGFVAGVSSYNFGALSRYKMPAELFFLVTLVLVYKIYKTKKELNFAPN